MPKQKTITDRSKKTEILEAYQEIQKELEALKKAPVAGPPGKEVRPVSEKKAALERERVVKPRMEPEVAAFRPDTLIQGISTLKITIANALGELEGRLVEESRTLEAIRKEIHEGKGMLKEVYDIELEAESLTDLRKKQEEERAGFQREIEEARSQWEREKRAREERVKDEEEAIRRMRERDSEEYQYQSKLKGQRNADGLEAELARKRADFEGKVQERDKAIRDREAALKAQEEETVRLRKEVDQFPKVLESKIKEAEKEAVRATEERFKVEKLMLEKEAERMKELQELTVKGLQERIAELNRRIQGLERDLKEAQAQTHAVATRAVEAIARLPFKSVRAEVKEGEGE